jgi:hypothetical protein
MTSLTSRLPALARRFGAPVWLVLACSACETPEPPAFTFYDDRIAPVMEVGCVQQTTGCHVAREDQTAVGNLDLSSYDALMRREDVLPATGPYTVGQLLLKGGSAIQVPVQTIDPPDPSAPERLFVPITTDVRHAGGELLQEGSEGYAALKAWVGEGYRRDGRVDEALVENEGPCRSGPGSHPRFDPKQAPEDQASYEAFVRSAQPVLLERCAGSSCHGTQVADLYLTCGDTEEELRWNYFISLAHLDPSVSLSELLRRPLSTLRGGVYHEGGNVFRDTEDVGYRALRKWVEDIVARVPELVRYTPEDEGLRYFGNYVQPMLVKKGCMFQNCHSNAMFHDLRLRGGAQGTFAPIAFEKNYDLSRRLLALESPDPNASRLIAKNLFPPESGSVGIAHRGGALLEDFAAPASAAACADFDITAQPLDQASAYCVLVAWHALERELSIAKGEIDPGPEHALLWVSRPLDVGDVRDFDRYRPGADLVRASLTLDDAGRPTLGAPTSLLAGCGLEVATADVRGPAVSWDGSEIAFAARSSAQAPLRLYRAAQDGSGCAPIAGISAAAASQNGILTHDFDPAFAPDGQLVFASTRGHLDGGYGFDGPTRTRSTLAPNANLYVYDGKAVRELTFLNNQELMPSFMGDGRAIFTTEKREPEFFQLAGRRQNLDGGDYHPLFAQRPSVGFEMATEIVELPSRDLALVAAPFGAKHGAGTIVIVNRSIGPDQDDRDPRDKLYVRSMRFPRPGAFDKQLGAFRSPAPLPSRMLIVSCDPDAMSLTADAIDFDLCVLDPYGNTLEVVGGEAGRADIEAVAIYARVNHGVFESRIDEANAHTRIEPGQKDAEVVYSDFPMIATLLFSNTREGRPIDPRLAGFEVLESLPPPSSAQSFDDLPKEKVVEDDFGRVYVDYDLLGSVPLYADGSAKIRIPGGHPVVLRMLDERGRALSFEAGAPFSGEQILREEAQFYPGERANQSFPRRLFNGMCGGCHGSITGYELDVAVDVDVLTSASENVAQQSPAVNLVP